MDSNITLRLSDSDAALLNDAIIKVLHKHEYLVGSREEQDLSDILAELRRKAGF